MKNLIWLSFFLASLFMIACQPPVTFDKPQPADIPPAGRFPARYQGKYQSMADNSILEINPNSIIRNSCYEEKIHLSQLDSSMQLIGDTLFDLVSSRGSAVQIEGDSIVRNITEIDTLFKIDALNVLKKYKGYYFINIFTMPANWQVQKLGFSRGKLTMSSINTTEDIEQLKALTESTQDSIPYVFSPTQKQFKKFVKDDGFRDAETFSRVRE